MSSKQPVKKTNPAEALWVEFHSRLRGFLYKRVPANDVDDILQDVFLRIHRNLGASEMPQNPLAWIHQVARSAVIDHYRKRKSDRSISFSNPEDEMGLEDNPTTVASDERIELGRCVVPFIERLRPIYRDALMWTAVEGMSQVDAAQKANVSVSGMKSRVQRARKALSSNIHACCEIEFDVRGKALDIEGCNEC